MPNAMSLSERREQCQGSSWERHRPRRNASLPPDVRERRRKS